VSASKLNQAPPLRPEGPSGPVIRALWAGIRPGPDLLPAGNDSLHFRRRNAILGSLAVLFGGYLHCALGSLVASGGDIGRCLQFLPEHLAWSFLLLPVLVAGAPAAHRLHAALSAGFLVLLSLWTPPPLRFQASYLATLTLIACSYRGETSTGSQHTTARPFRTGLILGALSFLSGGFLASSHLSGSLLLLSLGFFGMYAGLLGLLHSRTRRSAELERASVRPSFASLTLGLGSLLAWMALYGPGLSGVVLAAPSALWLLWLTALVTQHPVGRLRAYWVRGLIVPWVAMEIAVAVATAL